MRMNAIRFEWDGRKEKAYIEKHGVSFDEEKEYWRQGDSIIYKIWNPQFRSGTPEGGATYDLSHVQDTATFGLWGHIEFDTGKEFFPDNLRPPPMDKLKGIGIMDGLPLKPLTAN